MKKLRNTLAALAAVVTFTACTTDADNASTNLSTAAEQFEIARKITVWNGITGQVIQEVEGYCSIETDSEDRKLDIICATTDPDTGAKRYYKDFAGLSDNTTYYVQQLDPADVSVNRVRVIVRPEVLVPDFDRP